MKTAIINTLPNCPWCVKAKKLLDLRGIQYIEVNEKSDLWPTVPYIEIDGSQVGGFAELAVALRKM
jgi:glutaredoxin